MEMVQGYYPLPPLSAAYRRASAVACMQASVAVYRQGYPASAVVYMPESQILAVAYTQAFAVLAAYTQESMAVYMLAESELAWMIATGMWMLHTSDRKRPLALSQNYNCYNIAWLVLTSVHNQSRRYPLSHMAYYNWYSGACLVRVPEVGIA
jgi:hypothetical protein